MLTVHHLETSQSERIVWLCEERSIPYTLKIYRRDPVTRLAPADYKALHPLGTAPIITDDGLVLPETLAVVDYLLAKYGGGELVPDATDSNFADYLFWLHFANGTLQPSLGRSMMLNRLDAAPDHPAAKFVNDRRQLALRLIEERLGTVEYLAGSAFSVADIVTVFCLTTMRIFMPFDLSPYPHIKAYLQRIGARPGYREAMRKGDPGLVAMLT